MKKRLRKVYSVFMSSCQACVSTSMWLPCDGILRPPSSMARSMEGLELMGKTPRRSCSVFMSS